MRVLVVDDEPDLREAICTLLESAGHLAVAAANGREALECLATTVYPNVILLDLSMPVMDGWEFRRAQLDDAALAAIPVIVITADTDATEKMKRLAVQAFLRKPFVSDELIRTVARFCARSGAEVHA